LRLMCVTSTPSGRVSGSTAKLWFCALISTRPAGQSAEHSRRAAAMHPNQPYGSRLP
jgi:hypothetical protein